MDRIKHPKCKEAEIAAKRWNKKDLWGIKHLRRRSQYIEMMNSEKCLGINRISKAFQVRIEMWIENSF